MPSLRGRFPSVGRLLGQKREATAVEEPRSTPAATANGSNGSDGKLPLSPPAPGTIVKSEIAERWVAQVTNFVTPEIVSHYQTEANGGAIENQMAMFEEMEEKWPELRLALFKHKLKVAKRTPKIVVRPNAQNPKLARQKADFMQFVLEEVTMFHRTVFHLLDAVGKNLSGAEIDWRIGSVRGRQAVMIREVPWVNYRHFGYAFDAPELRLFKSLQMRTDPQPIPDRKFVIFEHLSKSGHTARGALQRALSWYFLIYLYAIKDWAALAETFGIDVAHAFVPTDATPEQRDKTLLHLSRMAAKAGVFDEGTKIELMRAASGSGNPQQALAKWTCEKATALLLGSTLATTAGDKGARSLGVVQDEETDELVDWSAVLLSATLTDTLVMWTMDFNFAQVEDDPFLELSGAGRRDLTALANILNILVQLKVKVPENWVHDVFGIPNPQRRIENGESRMEDGEGTEPILESAQPQGLNNSVPVTEQGEPLTGRSFTGDVFASGNEIIDAIRAQAIAKGKDIGAFNQVVAPLKALLARTSDPKAALAELRSVSESIEPTKLAGIMEEVMIVADLFGRASAREQSHGKPGALIAGYDVRWQKGDPRGGQFAPKDKQGEVAIDATNKYGGSTISVEGEIPKHGYIVSPSKSWETKIPGDTSIEQAAKAYHDFMAKHADELAKPNRFMGAWKDDDGNTVFDVVERVMDRTNAIGMGNSADQDAIFHLDIGKPINLKKDQDE